MLKKTSSGYNTRYSSLKHLLIPKKFLYKIGLAINEK
jgi:hypothetical protein